MKILRYLSGVHRASTIVLAVMLVANLAVSAALVREVLARKSVVLVPGITKERIAVSDEPPTEVVRDFALLYLAHFDGYTPATIDTVTRHLEGWLSPRFFAQASEALRKRKDLVSQTRMASQILLPKPNEVRVSKGRAGEFDVILQAVRRVYISDRLQSETNLAYVVTVEPGAPSLVNPYGLYVTGMSIAPKEPVDARKTE